MATEQTQHPEILWAQRSNEFDEDKNIIFFTVNLPNIIGEPELQVEDEQITFKAQAGSDAPGLPKPKTYAFTLPLYAPIVADLTKKSVTTRHVQLILRKKDAQEAFWPRITKEKGRNQWIKTDFAKWVDEDEQEEAPAPDESEFQGMGGQGGPPGGMPGMGGMGGMPGMGGMGGMGGGAGGPGGMDMASLMAQMGGGGAGGEGGAGGMDFAKLMQQMQASGQMPEMGDMPEGGDEDDSGDDDMPPLEDESAGSELDKTD